MLICIEVKKKNCLSVENLPGSAKRPSGLGHWNFTSAALESSVSSASGSRGFRC